MRKQTILIGICAVVFAAPAFAGGKHNQQAMIETMEAVPCGAKERGLTGLGSVFASIGATHVDSDEKLCPQYLLRTDDMEYHIRPLDHKHPRLLPVGQEGEIKISKDVLEMRIPKGDTKKRRYQVVAIKPIEHAGSSDTQSSDRRYEPSQAKKNSDKPYAEEVSPRKPN